MDRYEWSKSYREALRESEPAARIMSINLAVKECLRSLLDTGIDPERRAEQKEILCALSDLRVLIHLNRKFLIVQMSP